MFWRFRRRSLKLPSIREKSRETPILPLSVSKNLLTVSVEIGPVIDRDTRMGILIDLATGLRNGPVGRTATEEARIGIVIGLPVPEGLTNRSRQLPRPP
jgi:hypothetical protein